MYKQMLKNPVFSVTIMKGCFFTAFLILGCLSLPSYPQTGSPAPAATPAAPTEVNANREADATVRPSDSLTNNPPPPSEELTQFNYLSSKEFIIAILVTLVSLIALTMQFFLLKQIPKLRAEDTLRTFGVILIIMGTLFVIAAGFDSIQIAPAMGLFGTIAGYLLGRVERKQDEKAGIAPKREGENID